MNAHHARTFAAIVLLTGLASAARAQGVEPPLEPQPLGNYFTVGALADLPSGATIFSLLDTSVPELISDRIDAGSLTAGQAARFGAHGSSWTQTMFRIGDVDISLPRSVGTPFIVPTSLGWQRVEVASGALPLDVNSPGPVVTLVPLPPVPVWTRVLEFSGAPGGLLSRTATTIPPAIARLDGWRSASLLASGPIVPNRVGMVLTLSATNTTHFERSDSTTLSDKLATMFTNVVFTPGPEDAVRFVGWVQRARSPFEHRTAYGQPAAAERASSFHVQSTWQRTPKAGAAWSGFASFSGRRRTTELEPVPAIVVERLTEGPIPDLVAPIGTDRAWSIGAKLAPSSVIARHTLQAGVSLSGGSAGGSAPFSVRIGELVSGLPSRVWDYSTTGTRSHSHQWTLAAYAGDTFSFSPRVTFDGGLRFESVTGGAAGNANGISWHDLFPSMGLRWEVTNYKRIAALVRFNRYGYRLPLGHLAYGDSSAPTANVYVWAPTGSDPAVKQLGRLIARSGPGTGGDPDFSALDPGLQRPYVNELTFGVESRPSDRTILRLIGVVRHEGQLIGLVNTGAPITAYTEGRVLDEWPDHAGGQLLPVWNRKPSSFGADRYLLTNPAGHHATFASAEVTGQTRTDNWFLIAGFTAGRSEETSANRGFQVNENDHGLVGEVFTDPNAAVNARGRPFTERGYTFKMAGTYRLSNSARFGLSARYQDGQHFARLVIVPGLNQGVEAIRAFVNGKTRFTYTLTVDARLQKDFAIPGGSRLTGVIDAYNVLNTRTEIEEFSVTGPLSRTISAVQPPRSIHLGVRLTF